MNAPYQTACITDVSGIFNASRSMFSNLSPELVYSRCVAQFNLTSNDNLVSLISRLPVYVHVVPDANSGLTQHNQRIFGG